MRNSVELYIALTGREQISFIEEKGKEEYDRLVTHLLTVPSVKDYIRYVNNSETVNVAEKSISDVLSDLPKEG